MDNLFCLETIPSPNSGDDLNTEPIVSEDPTILRDDRVLENLLELQKTTMPNNNYFTHVQKEIKPYMRKIVTSWMLEVRTDASKFKMFLCLHDGKLQCF